MRISTTILLTDETIRPARLARELEARGFGGLYLPEHTHIPVSRQTPAPMGGPLPRPYGRTLDPFVGLAAAATVTEGLALGTSVALVAQHDPIALAKQAATLDWMSEGRFTLGVGFGWNVEEANDHGVEWRTRRSLVRDRIALMRALWAAEPTAYEGEFASVSASHAHPKPVRPGGPRLLLGGAAGPTLFAHIAEYADGWLPVGGSGLSETLPDLRRAWEAAGRKGTPGLVPGFVVPAPGKLKRYRDLGAEEVLLQLPSGPEDEVLRTLDDYARYL
ncbi:MULTISPECIES: TIGR03619 family F420-dependent LLM class oxidoreductase [unclassified Streptomyces]|uniref:TIGR03619 family F420-dependent LLM class oxidoreductase n=1 Tax=unclassified Streptomyces TaxID=2593676 RepID=UPI002DDA3E17|nr:MULTISPECIES: TIGR03619 family F420-dependent LLM class oxidoreductase [unclassified Streptomyces]WSA94093.1 TIGR03619 family F420-dependent LLM class oxidoreductase [Streptomyces sp. NBC_01795]WSB78518.1 TIGR03619 family F420-dependent LLM class oxidoreductase [Streptomyces sp. NBC_01775]WSS13282.1 TIGR03619 family F420-dependent LLM class oxidoreductase [Streptomyces sp. NBC_01186]WSS42069.1 TIGR03619 family F420-dependent LLM class oxidoreductase [Streptomyces sp. NBC_01187]